MEIIFYLFIVLVICGIIFSLYYFQIPTKKTSLRDLYAEGLDMLIAGKRNSAYRNFKSIIEQDSNNIKAYLYLGQVVREGGNANKALEIHKNLLLRNKLSNYDKIELYKNLSLDFYQLGNIDKSIEYTKMIINIENINDWAIKQLIKYYKENNDWVHASEYLKVYLKIKNKQDNKKIALYKIQEGRILIKNNSYQSARDKFEESIELNPDLFIAFYFIGNSFAEESNYIYDQSIQLDNENIENSLDRNDQSKKMKKEAENILAKAIPMWSHFIENMPDYSWMILPTLKDALQALNRYDEIEKILLKSTKGKNVDILSHLADFYANKGEIDQALNTINKALENNKLSLLAQLKKIKIKALNNKESNLSAEVDKLIVSLLKDKRFLKYKESYNTDTLKWLFEENNIV